MGAGYVRWLLLPLLVLAGCHNPFMVAGRFEESYREYNHLVRWDERERACMTFADPAVEEECLSRARGARGVSVVDYRVKGVELDPDRGIGTVRVEFDYYLLPSARLRTLEDLQRWRYDLVEGSRRWRIVTPLPDFR